MPSELKYTINDVLMRIEYCQDDETFKALINPQEWDGYYYFVLPGGHTVPAGSPDDVLVVEKVKV